MSKSNQCTIILVISLLLSSTLVTTYVATIFPNKIEGYIFSINLQLLHMFGFSIDDHLSTNASIHKFTNSIESGM